MPFDNGNPRPVPGSPPHGGAPMKKSTRNWLIIGTLAGAGLVIWWVMKSRKSATATSDGTTDPATGIPYSQEYGGYGVSGTSPSLYGYVDPTTGAFISGAGAVSPSTVIAPSTNASWAQQVEAYLTTLGYEPMAIASALGHYLTGQTLTSDEAGIVAAAKGFFGPPPQGAPAPVTTPPSGNGSGGGLSGHFKTLHVLRAEMLKDFAKEHHWTDATLKLVEQINNLTPTSRLRKGQTIIRPIK